MIRLSLYVFLWIASMAIAIFATQNTYLITLQFFTLESIKLPLGLVLIFCAGFGATCINFWQTSISFELPRLPKFSISPTKNNPLKSPFANKNSVTKKDVSKTKKIKDDFDEDWNDDWE